MCLVEASGLVAVVADSVPPLVASGTSALRTLQTLELGTSHRRPPVRARLSLEAAALLRGFESIQWVPLHRLELKTSPPQPFSQAPTTVQVHEILIFEKHVNRNKNI
jgi:hypothetical protein